MAAALCEVLSIDRDPVGRGGAFRRDFDAKEELQGWAPKPPPLAETAMTHILERNDEGPRSLWRDVPLKAYEGDLCSVHERLLRNPQNIYEMACMLDWWGMRPPRIVDKILWELDAGFAGVARDWCGEVVDLKKVDFMDQFGEEVERRILEMLDRVKSGPGERRCRKRLSCRLMLISFAIEIDLHRHLEI